MTDFGNRTHFLKWLLLIRSPGAGMVGFIAANDRSVRQVSAADAGLKWYLGPTCFAPPDLRRATTELVAARYAEQIVHLHDLIRRDLGLTPDSVAFALEYARRYCALFEELSHSEANEMMYVMYTHGKDGAMIPLATMRAVRGTARAGVSVTSSIGDPLSSIPSHTTLQGFRYPSTASFDPDASPESSVTEIKRLAAITSSELSALIANGTVSRQLATYLARHAVDELFTTIWHEDRMRGDPPAAYFLQTHPRLAFLINTSKSVTVRPLFQTGVELTDQAFAIGLGAHYAHWKEELAALVPGELLACGLSTAMRHLYSRGMGAWKRCSLLMPFAMLNDSHLATELARVRSRICDSRLELFEQTHVAGVRTLHAVPS